MFIYCLLIATLMFRPKYQTIVEITLGFQVWRPEISIATGGGFYDFPHGL
jgi:hypothetical protein